MQSETTDRKLASVPLRILPSTGPRPLRLLALGGLLIVACGSLAIEAGIASGRLPPVGSWGGIRWSSTYNGQPNSDGAWHMIAILAIALALTFFNLTREIVYLSPGSRYWIEVSAKGIELASPLTRRRYRRQEVSAFVVRSLPLRSWRVLRVIARGARWRWIWIRSDDFATGLAPSRKEAAEIFASTLNDLLGQVGAGQDATVRIPAGLKVEAVTEGSRESPVKAAPVVRRL